MLLNRASYLVRNRFDDVKKVEVYDVMDPETHSVIGIGLEKEPEFWLKWIRWAFGRNLFPTAVWIYENNPWRPAFCIRELRTLWAPRLEVFDADGRPLCRLQAKFATVGGGFGIRDSSGRPIAELQNEPGTWNYRFLSGTGRQIGIVEEQIVEECGRSADRNQAYFVSATGSDECGRVASVLLLATALALDLVYRDRV